MTVVCNDGGWGGEKAWMTAGTFREKQAEGKVTYRDKQEREREEETDRRRRMQTGLQQPVRLRNQTRAVVWKNMLPLPASTAPPPGYRSRGPAQVLYPCINLSKAQSQQSVLGEARAASRQLSKILL